MDKRVIEIADYMSANLCQNRGEVVAHFVEKWHKSKRTVERYITNAKDYNSARLQLTQKAATDTMVAETIKRAKKGLKSQTDWLEKLEAEIKELDSVRCKTPNDFAIIARAKAQIIAQVSAMQGYNAPQKIDVKSNVEIDRPMTRKQYAELKKKLTDGK